MSWQPLERFRDPSVPKLNNLRRAARAGLRVPPTWWIAAQTLTSALASPPAQLGEGPLIIRSGSPTEDQRTTSNAGQLLSLAVRQCSEFADSLRRVVQALPRDEEGLPRGAVFVQPLVVAEEAGVAFFDGFYYERTSTAGTNVTLTSGQARGEVCRGHLARAEPWSQWLASIYAVFGEEAGGDERLDIEYARDATGFVLFQVRPALFPLARNQTLTLANARETLGDLPSPWAVSTLAEAARDLSFLTTAEPGLKRWGDSLIVELAERPWINLSLWFRLLDRAGLPRTFVTLITGGDRGSPADGMLSLGRLVKALPRLLQQTWKCFQSIWDTKRNLRQLDLCIEKAQGLDGLFQSTIKGWILLVHTAMAIVGPLALVARARRLLRLPSAGRLVTQVMMEEYSRLGTVEGSELDARLDAWLARHGHRGPWESDLARPRFTELRELLRQDLAAATPSLSPPRRRKMLDDLLRPFFWIDERREWFRDVCMQRWQRIRRRLLDEGARLVAAGQLDEPQDVFWLRRQDLQGPLPLREAVAQAKRRAEAVRRVALPLTASRETIQTLLAKSATAQAAPDGRVFPGISLSSVVIEGRAVKADDLMVLLSEAATTAGLLGPDVILVVPTLEPSWAVVFPRVGGVVAEVGGELSHASILLREARRPAIVNCAGIYRRVSNGDRLRLDGPRGVVELIAGK
jgi:pyruvate,water dikinase